MQNDEFTPYIYRYLLDNLNLTEGSMLLTNQIPLSVFILPGLNKKGAKMEKLPMDADILPPSDDRIFKVLLTHPNAKQVLIDVISSVIDQNIVDVHIKNNEIPAMDIDEKNERLDVNCTIDTGDQINVEMHCNRQDEIESKHTNFINKYVYFLTDLHSSQ